MKLTQVAILALRGSQKIREAISTVCEVTPSTVNRWIADNDDQLTRAAVLNILRRELKLSDEQILEDTVKTDA